MSTRISDYEHEFGKARTVADVENLVLDLWYDDYLNDTARVFIVQGRLDTCVLPADYPIWDVLHAALVALEE